MDQTVRLIDFFTTRRDELRQRLPQNRSVEAAQRVVKTFLDRLFVDYQQAQPDPQRSRLASAVADCLIASSELMLAASKVTVWHAESEDPWDDSATREPARLWWPPLVRVIAATALAGWLFVIYPGTVERVMAGAGLAVILIMELIGSLVPALRHSRESRQSRLPPLQTRPAVEVDIDTLLLRLRDALVMADKVLDHTPLSAAVNPSPAIPDTLLDYLQELSAAHLTNDPQYALALAKRVPSLLVPFDIALQTMPDEAQRNQFTQVASLEDTPASGPRVVKPALLREGRVIRRGEISVPNPAPQPRRSN